MDFWEIVLSKTLQEIDSETEISCRKFSGECEAVRGAGFGRERSKTAMQVQERPQQALKHGGRF